MDAAHPGHCLFPSALRTKIQDYEAQTEHTKTA